MPAYPSRPLPDSPPRFFPYRCFCPLPPFPVVLADSPALWPPIIVKGGEKSARLWLKAADELHNKTLLATFGHSQNDSIPDFRSSQEENRFVIKMKSGAGKKFD
jgi:hypothetical protein